MARLSRWLIICAFLLHCPIHLLAETASDKAFRTAQNFFEDQAFDRAEAAFAEFSQKFTNSARLPEATLYQALARLHQTNYTGAIQLLSAGQTNASKWADEYLFQLGQAWFQKGDYATAAATFAKLAQHPSSARALDAIIGQADAGARLSDWSAVTQLLEDTNGLFQTMLRSTSFASATSPQQTTNSLTQAPFYTTPPAELALRGQLLLTEARLAQHRYPAAESGLQPLATLVLEPKLDWQRQYLVCRIKLATGHLPEADECSTNLLALAAKTMDRNLLAESTAFRASLFEHGNKTDEAIGIYKTNLMDGVPPRYQREALLKITQLSLSAGRLADAAGTLEKFLARFRTMPEADAALLGLGELYLEQHRAGLCTNGVRTALSAATPENPTAQNLQTNTPTAPNCLALAIRNLQDLTTSFPQSTLLGKAFLDLAWCFWEQGRMLECQTNCQAAIEKLPLSPDQATAYFKLADAQFRLNNFAAALTNYNLLVSRFAQFDQIKTNLFEPALYQAVQAALAKNDLPAATNAMSQLMNWFPTGFHTERAVLLTGQQMRRQGNPAAARATFLEFDARAPNSTLRPQLHLAIARSYEEEGRWTNAIAQYDRWLAAFTNNPARPQTEFYRARANLLAGSETNALALLSEFLTKYPTNDLVPLARLSEADQYFNAGKFGEAEVRYQLLFQNPQLPATRMTYEARMMAGRAAVAQQDWKGAQEYFLSLFNDNSAPDDLRTDALLAYGDAWMSRAGDSKGPGWIPCYSNAFNAFDAVLRRSPTNQHAVAIALGEKASALLQWARDVPQYYEDASNAFQLVIITNADVTIRSMAKIGLATVLEKQAAVLEERSNGLDEPAKEKLQAQRTALLNQALANCQDVLYGTVVKDDEQADLYWTREAGLRAAHFAEVLGKWQMAKKVYERLRAKFPSRQAQLDKDIQRCADRAGQE
ncbi:MAG: hypothetical protein C5B50_11610 [Verrucomicrobia bacterium]|nr:MAG: hypothetical protein C5B50_11610 [Verrucomicrobiota bacterium]